MAMAKTIALTPPDFHQNNLLNTKMSTETQDKPNFASRNFHLMMLVSQSIGLSAASVIPKSAIQHGPLGYIICYMLVCIILGIPLLYMELIIGQFTGLNSLEVWKVRHFVSHSGHVLVLWQFLILYFNHVMATFTIHYLFISFENPRPYYTCGPWTDKNCDISTANFTIIQDCINSGPKFAYCERLYKTFPATQYFKYLVGKPIQIVRMDWRLCLPSGIACILLYLSCFKRRRSMEWFLGVLTLYPGFGFVLLMLGSMVQKGILLHYQDAMDINFDRFFSNFNVFELLPLVIYTISLGTGLVVNVGASCPFRAPCYANAVITMAANVGFQLVLVVTSAMLICPYSYEHDISPDRVVKQPIGHIFERIPTMLREYDNNYVWVVISFSSYTCVALRTNIIVYYNLLEMFCKRFSIIAKYPGLVTFGVTLFLFLTSMPFLCYLLIVSLSKPFRLCMQLFNMIVVIIECFVFILCYGLDRFSEDVHFMQGIRPSNYTKLAWIVSSILLIYVCGVEMYYIEHVTSSLDKSLGLFVFSITAVYLVGVAGVKVVVGLCRREGGAAVRLRAEWRPRSELLQRSRAMFTAQAMTKEYLYRQYHLQAGILARQLRANRTRIISTDV